MMEVHRATVPAHITFWGGPFSRETVDAVRREPGVTDVEGEMASAAGDAGQRVGGAGE